MQRNLLGSLLRLLLHEMPCCSPAISHGQDCQLSHTVLYAVSAFFQHPLNRTTGIQRTRKEMRDFHSVISSRKRHRPPGNKPQHQAYRAGMTTLILYPIRQQFMGYGIDPARGEGPIQPTGGQRFSPLVLASSLLICTQPLSQLSCFT